MLLMQGDSFGGVLAMCGTSDKNQTAVVLTSHLGENIIRLHGLPDFDDRGLLTRMADPRAIAATPGGLIVAGDSAGTVKMWQWR